VTCGELVTRNNCFSSLSRDSDYAPTKLEPDDITTHGLEQNDECFCAVDIATTIAVISTPGYFTPYIYEIGMRPLTKLEYKAEGEGEYDELKEGQIITIGNTFSPNIEVRALEEDRCFTLEQCKDPTATKQPPPSVKITNIEGRLNKTFSIVILNEKLDLIHICGYKGLGKPYFSIRSSFLDVLWHPQIDIPKSKEVFFRIGESASFLTSASDPVNIRYLTAIPDGEIITQVNNKFFLLCNVVGAHRIQLSTDFGQQTTIEITCVETEHYLELFDIENNVWNRLVSSEIQFTPQSLQQIRVNPDCGTATCSYRKPNVLWNYSSKNISPTTEIFIFSVENGRNELSATLFDSIKLSVDVVGTSGEFSMISELVIGNRMGVQSIPEVIIPTEQTKLQFKLSGGSGNYKCSVNGVNQEIEPTNSFVIQTSDYSKNNLPSRFGELTVACSDEHTQDSRVHTFFLGLLTQIKLSNNEINVSTGDESSIELQLFSEIAGKQVQIEFENIGTSVGSLVNITPTKLLRHYENNIFQVTTAIPVSKIPVTLSVFPEFSDGIVNAEVNITVIPNVEPVESPVYVEYCAPVPLFRSNVEYVTCVPGDDGIEIDGIRVIGIKPGTSTVTCTMDNNEEKKQEFTFEIVVNHATDNDIGLHMDLYPAKIVKASIFTVNLGLKYSLAEEHISKYCQPSVELKASEGLTLLDLQNREYKATGMAEQNITASVTWGGRTFTQTKTIHISRDLVVISIATAGSTLFCIMLGICYYLYTRRAVY